MPKPTGGGSWAVGRPQRAAVSGPGAAGTGQRIERSASQPVKVKPRATGRPLPDRAPRMSTGRPSTGHRVQRIAGRGSPTGRSGSRSRAPDRAPRKTGKGPRHIGSNRRLRIGRDAPRSAAPGLAVPGLGPCFSQIFTYFFVSALTVLYLRLKSHTLRAMFHVEHAQNVSRETSKTACQKLAGGPYECSAKPCFRREKTEA